MVLKNIFNGVFKGKTVFVTGHTGFIGTWLSLWLKSLDAKVIGYSLGPPTNPSLFETVGLDKHVTDNRGDVRDFTRLHECILEHKPEFVFHLAAQSLVRLSYEKPVDTFQTNIMGVVNILESIKDVSSVKACVVMTSDKCYENTRLDYAYKESDPMGGYDPYSASKGAAELVITSYRNSFFHPSNGNIQKVGVSSIRAGNVIGGGDWANDRIIPDCMRSFISQKPISIRHPNAIRPWQYVLEPISGLLVLAAKMWENPDKYSQAWNFGPAIPHNKITVKELVDQIIEQWGEGKCIDISKQTSAPHEATSLMLDSSKAMKMLDWKPVCSIKEAISETVSWYQSFVAKSKGMKDFTQTQIENYVKKAQQMNIAWAKDST